MDLRPSLNRSVIFGAIGFAAALVLISFLAFAEAQSVSTIQNADPAFLRSYILMFSEQHNPGGLHAAFRSIRAFLFWVEKEELMPVDWKNPIKKVDASPRTRPNNRTCPTQ